MGTMFLHFTFPLSQSATVYSTARSSQISSSEQFNAMFEEMRAVDATTAPAAALPFP